MVEDWCVVQVVLQQCDAIEFALVYLPEQVKLFHGLLLQELAVGANMPVRNILTFLVQKILA